MCGRYRLSGRKQIIGENLKMTPHGIRAMQQRNNLGFFGFFPTTMTGRRATT